MGDMLETRFVIAPITTALQKLGRPDVRACVLATVRDDEPVPVGELRKALAAWPRRHQGDVVFGSEKGTSLIFGEPRRSAPPRAFYQAEARRLQKCRPEKISLPVNISDVPFFVLCGDQLWHLGLSDSPSYALPLVVKDPENLYFRVRHAIDDDERQSWDHQLSCGRDGSKAPGVRECLKACHGQVDSPRQFTSRMSEGIP